MTCYMTKVAMCTSIWEFNMLFFILWQFQDFCMTESNFFLSFFFYLLSNNLVEENNKNYKLSHLISKILNHLFQSIYSYHIFLLSTFTSNVITCLDFGIVLRYIVKIKHSNSLDHLIVFPRNHFLPA